MISSPHFVMNILFRNRSAVFVPRCQLLSRTNRDSPTAHIQLDSAEPAQSCPTWRSCSYWAKIGGKYSEPGKLFIAYSGELLLPLVSFNFLFPTKILDYLLFWLFINAFKIDSISRFTSICVKIQFSVVIAHKRPIFILEKNIIYCITNHNSCRKFDV